MSDDAARLGDCVREWSRLQSLWSAADVAANSSVLTDAQRNGARSSLSSARVWLDRLGPSGDLYGKVAAGSLSFAKWAEIANAQGAQIQNAVDASDWRATASRMWSEIVVTSAAQVVDDVKGAVPEAIGLTKWLVVGAVAVAVVVVMK